MNYFKALCVVVVFSVAGSATAHLLAYLADKPAKPEAVVLGSLASYTLIKLYELERKVKGRK